MDTVFEVILFSVCVVIGTFIGSYIGHKLSDYCDRRR